MENLPPELAGLDLEALDPSPDVHSLFAYYNSLYFDNQLGACSVEWSTKRMTLCAGVCHFSRSGGCRIKLSEPLLKFRPVRDLKETLLHEMIHAALFLGNVRDDGDHGPKFKAVMNKINKATCADSQRPPGGYNITVYHTMHDEVNNYRTHVWRCTACGNMVRRSMNRPPQEADCRSYSKSAAAAAAAPGGAYCQDQRCWYHGHVRTCGGVYEKIAEPEKQPPAPKAPAGGSSGSTGIKHPNAANKRRAAAAAGAPTITSFFPKREAQPTQQDLSQPQQQAQQGGQQQQIPAQAAADRHDGPAGQQQQQQQQSQPSSSGSAAAAKPPDARAAAAAAALARAGGSSHAAAAAAVPGSQAASRPPAHKQQQQQTLPVLRQPSVPRPPLPQQRSRQGQRSSQQAEAAEVVDLLSSEDEVDEGPTAAAAAETRQRTGQVAQGDAGGLSLSGAALAAGSAGVGGGVRLGTLMCPVCCLEFQELGALNVHLDECLV